jgi:hypothetical protein
MSRQPLAPLQPRLFIGASTGGLQVAELLRTGLADVAVLTSWSEGGPAPAARTFDAAAFVLCMKPGHDVLLRLGVFLGVLGRERIVVCPASTAVLLPAELSELAVAPHPSAVREHLRRLDSLAGSANDAPSLPATDVVSQVARRRRRTLGTARSTKPELAFRIADISMSGALLETYGEIPENLVLDLTMTLEDGTKVEATAQVVRIQYPQWGRVGGAGVKFLRFDGDSQLALRRYLEADPGTMAVAGEAVGR